ncbi:MAG: PQQ-binding-like beta-propeller repeat protein, partial [Vicinamibacterales bacterium]
VAQQARPIAAGDWPMYRGDAAATGYSPLKQITPRNVASLTQAWSYPLLGSGPAAPAAGGGTAAPAPVNSQVTPIVVDGVMYLPAVNRVVALEADSGREIWSTPISGSAPSRRGLGYWPGDGSHGPRLFVMAVTRLLALDARSGTPVANFGNGGAVEIGVPYNSVPGVFRNVVVVGANTPPRTIGGIGNPRAYDARTGAKLWEFSSVAQPGQPGHETWAGESWKGRLGANAWPFYFSFDEQRGLLYLPLASPIPGWYGGDRAGANLYGNSVVAVDIQTGAYKWHFQTIHHDIWDHDPPAPPSLFDIRRSGRTIPALGLTTKSGYLYILNRETGQPLYGVDEKVMPKSDVPGEVTFPTQPIPTKPPALARVSYAASDLVTATDTSPEHAKACAELVEKVGGVKNLGPFTPWGYKPEGATPPSTLLFPGGVGGANWGGTAYDPATGYLIVSTQDVGALGSIEKSKPGAPLPYDKTTPGRASFDVRMGDQAWPCQTPPWGRLTAVNVATGDIAWQVPLGVTDELPPAKQKTGRPMLAGAIATGSGLLFIAATDDNRIRAVDARRGTELWEARLAKRGNANPMTFQAKNGKQYVAIVASDTLVVYGLR